MYVIQSHLYLQVEKAKQDDALSDISSILGELKDMAIDMGSEIERLVMWIHLHGSPKKLVHMPPLLLLLINEVGMLHSWNCRFIFHSSSTFWFTRIDLIIIIIAHDYHRQNKSLDHFYDDVDEVDMRVKNANQRARRLLGK